MYLPVSVLNCNICTESLFIRYEASEFQNLELDLSRSRSKVRCNGAVDPICDFLLVFNSNHMSVFHISGKSHGTSLNWAKFFKIFHSHPYPRMIFFFTIESFLFV